MAFYFLNVFISRVVFFKSGDIFIKWFPKRNLFKKITQKKQTRSLKISFPSSRNYWMQLCYDPIGALIFFVYLSISLCFISLFLSLYFSLTYSVTLFLYLYIHEICLFEYIYMFKHPRLYIIYIKNIEITYVLYFKWNKIRLTNCLDFLFGFLWLKQRINRGSFFLFWIYCNKNTLPLILHKSFP